MWKWSGAQRQPHGRLAASLVERQMTSSCPCSAQENAALHRSNSGNAITFQPQPTAYRQAPPPARHMPYTAGPARRPCAAWGVNHQAGQWYTAPTPESVVLARCIGHAAWHEPPRFRHRLGMQRKMQPVAIDVQPVAKYDADETRDGASTNPNPCRRYPS